MTETEEEQGERQDTKVSTKQRLVNYQSKMMSSTKEITKTAQKIVIGSKTSVEPSINNKVYIL